MSRHVVDLYAGPGGWDEGMKALGIRSIGIELDPDACRTAYAAGHPRVRADVATYPTEPFAGCWGLVASPPCQAWSMAGKRAGELDRPRVHALVDAYAAGADKPGDGWVDERSHHAAQPVRWVRDIRPRWVALEQVPPVLGLWRHVGEVFRRWGYSTWTGILNAADFGVPQTRERAFLLASLGRVARPPVPTHAKVPGDDLLGGRLEPWVSMAEALGWHGTGWALDRRTNSAGPRGTTEPVAAVPVDRPAPTVTATANAAWVLRTEQRSGTAAGRVPIERESHEPAPTLVANADRWELHSRRDGPGWVEDPRVGRPGHKDRESGESQFERESLRITVTEAAVLQSFRADYPWRGPRTQRFRQVGNACPPLLAMRVVEALTSEVTG